MGKDTGQEVAGAPGGAEPSALTVSSTVDEQELAELIRIISEYGADDPEELAHEVYQVLKPDGPGCWAEDETDWQAEYCRVHAELQGAYAEISALQRESAENRQACERTFVRLRDIELDESAASSRGDAG